MKTKKLSVLLLSIVFAVLLALSGITFYLTSARAENEVGNVIATFKNEYESGAKIGIPDAYFETGNNQVKAKKTVVYPDGRQYSVDEFTPETMGTYTIRYSATSGGKYYSESKEIYVYGNLYNVSDEYSTLRYGTNHVTPNTYGLNVGLTADGTFHYNKIIDLTKLNDEPFVTLYVAPDVIGEADGYELDVRLTDAYDSDNYVEIRVKSFYESITYNAMLSYLSAGAAFQPSVGFDYNIGSKHYDNWFGFGQQLTF